jgi:hypothetical protein
VVEVAGAFAADEQHIGGGELTAIHVVGADGVAPISEADSRIGQDRRIVERAAVLGERAASEVADGDPPPDEDRAVVGEGDGADAARFAAYVDVVGLEGAAALNERAVGKLADVHDFGG